MHFFHFFAESDHRTWPDVVFALVMSIGGWLAFGSSIINHVRLNSHDEALKKTQKTVDENNTISREISKTVNGKKPRAR